MQRQLQMLHQVDRRIQIKQGIDGGLITREAVTNKKRA
jgi:hypothetical protein